MDTLAICRRYILIKTGFAACILVCLVAAQAAFADEICALVLNNLTDRSLLIEDSQGNTSEPLPKDGHLLLDTMPGMDGVAVSDTAYQFTFSGGAAYALEWMSTEQPFGLSLECSIDSSNTRIYRYYSVPGGGNKISLDVIAGDAPVLRRDTTGDGKPDIVVTPDVSLTGAAADDRIPPVVEHVRLSDGSHLLRLVDNETDITSDENLFYSLDRGEHYSPYDGPMMLDPERSPIILAIGRDAVGNPSRVHAFLTRGEQQDFCVRVQADRTNAQSIIETALAEATADGVLPENPSINILASGRGACLWRRGDAGEDLSCTSCTDNYEPGIDQQQLTVYYPDTIDITNRDQFLGLLEQKSSESRFNNSRISFSKADKSDLETSLSAVSSGLAPQAGLLTLLLEGEYVELTDGAILPDISLDTALEKLKSVSKIPRLEGYELALLGERELYRTDFLIRIAGLSQGMNAGLPQLDSWLNRRLRMQLTMAAGGALDSALGVMLADSCAVDKAIAFATRQAYRTTVCGGMPCGSFGEYVSARASESASQCPETFINDELGILQQYAAIEKNDAVALEPLVADECSGNGMLAEALMLLEGFKARVQTVYQTQMEVLQSSNPAEHSTRKAHADSAAADIAGRRQLPAANLTVSVTNTGVNPMPAATIRMYDNNTFNDQAVTVALPVNSAEVIVGDHVSGIPFFIQTDAASVQPNTVRTASFVLDTGATDNDAPEEETFGGFNYYLFNPDEPICPDPTPVEPPDSGGGG